MLDAQFTFSEITLFAQHEKHQWGTRGYQIGFFYFDYEGIEYCLSIIWYAGWCVYAKENFCNSAETRLSICFPIILFPLSRTGHPDQGIGACTFPRVSVMRNLTSAHDALARN